MNSEKKNAFLNNSSRSNKNESNNIIDRNLSKNRNLKKNNYKYKKNHDKGYSTKKNTSNYELDLNPSSHPLQNKWVVWYHPVPSQNDTKDDWSLDSYIKIGDFQDIVTFWTYYNNINWIGDNLFFLMKEDIRPLWEDSNNENGGCWCYKVKRTQAMEIWNEISMVLIGNNCDDIDNINGISISPKMNYSTIKVWVDNPNVPQSFIKNIDLLDSSKAIFKLWKDST